MKTISLYQPWASAMALGLKTIETRPTRIHHRGLVAIHAAKKWTEDEQEWCEDFARQFAKPALLDPPRGCVIAYGRIVDCKPAEELLSGLSYQEALLGNYAPKRFGWIFEGIIPLEVPIPWRGQQGQFNVPDHLFPVGSGI